MAVKERRLSVATFPKSIQKYLHYFKRNVNEFLENSTIHGLRYFNERNLSIFDRTFFIVTFAGIVAASIYFVSVVNAKWSTSPTIISINNVPAFIVREPFPSVTICNMNQALKSRVANFAKNSKEYEMVQFSCGMKSNSTVLDAIKDWRIATELILNVSQTCEQMLLDCTFGGVAYNCTDLFHPVIMDEGLCCTFNSLDPVYKFENISNQFNFNISYPPNVKPVDYSLENGYRNPLPKHYSPMKAIGYGLTVGLNIVLNVDSDEYYCSTSKSMGFKLSIHNPEVESNIRENGLLLPPGQESFVRLLPTQLIADKKLRNLSRKERKCLFEEESKLNVFSHYSYENCMYECRNEMIITHCGCIPAHIISKYSNWTVCSHKDQPCVLRAYYLSKRNGQLCGRQCWPKCFSKSYKVDIFSAKLNKTFLEISSPIIANMSSAYVDKNIAVARFYMKRYTYESIIKSPYIDAIDVLASVGGLIGVFMGFSFISLMEIIYYLCIRPKRSKVDQGKNIRISLRKPCLPLAKRSRTIFVNPYKFSTNSPQSLHNPAARRQFVAHH